MNVNSILNGLCRVCAKNEPKMENIFIPQTNGSTFAEMLAVCTQKPIPGRDDRPKNICETCIPCLESAFDFHNQIKSSEELFKQMIWKNQLEAEASSEGSVSLDNIDVIELYTKTEPPVDIPLDSNNENENQNEQSNEMNETGEVVAVAGIPTSIPINAATKTTSKSKRTKTRKITNRTYECYMCRWQTKSYKKLRTHNGQHNSETPHKCDICSMWFSDTNFLRHLCKGKSVQCEYCTEVFETTLSLRKHLNCHEKNFNLHKCTECHKTFPMSYFIECHKHLHTDLEKPYSCPVCNAKFRYNFAMKKHLQSHSDERPHLCAECGMGFKTAAALRNHAPRHSDVKPIACPHCPRRFYDKGGLKKHMDVHSDKKYICNLCGAVLSSRRSHDEHKRIRHRNAGERACNLCPIKCKTYYSLKRHLLTHTGEKPHKCQYCDRAFTQSGDLNKHLRSHIGENTYQCECGETFRLQADLRKHSYTHFKENSSAPEKNL